MHTGHTRANPRQLTHTHHLHLGADELGGAAHNGAGGTSSSTRGQDLPGRVGAGRVALLKVLARLVEGGEVDAQQHHVAQQRGHCSLVEREGALALELQGG
jgi:hypothetical protein